MANFSHPLIEERAFDDIPLDQDIYLVDEKWIDAYAASLQEMLAGNKYDAVGYVSRAAARKRGPDSIEISWYPNIYDRFHEVSLLLPRSAFVQCVECPSYDEKPRIFVKGDWLTKLYLRPYSMFALVDAIGVKNAIRHGDLSGHKLLVLRERIDALAARYPGIAFVSFADSLLLKSNWHVGQYDSEVEYSYEPEAIVRLIPELAALYRELLGMDIYTAIAQGVNEYEDVSLLHTSPGGNHISLNSLGLPFAQVLSIDTAVRQNLRAGAHAPHELYIDEHCFNSFQFRVGFNKYSQSRAEYIEPLSAVPRRYIYTNSATFLGNLESVAGQGPE